MGTLVACPPSGLAKIRLPLPSTAASRVYPPKAFMASERAEISASNLLRASISFD